MKKLFLIVTIFNNIQTATDYYTIYCHGIVDGPSQADRFSQAFGPSTIKAVCFPDATSATGYNFNNGLAKLVKLLTTKQVNRTAMYMGQSADLSALSETLTKISDQSSVVLYGCSRGAAVTMTYLGMHNPDNVKAIVLDACPTSLPDTIQMKLASFGIDPSYAPTLFSYLFPSYDPSTALTPLQAISQIKNKQLPILLVHSQQDTVVPIIHSILLYQTFKNHGFTNVHLAILPTGRHSFLLQDTTIRDEYLKAVHSFYKKYHMPYDTTWASDHISTTNLTPDEIMVLHKKYEQKVQETYQKSHTTQKNIAFSALFSTLALAALYKYYW